MRAIAFAPSARARAPARARIPARRRGRDENSTAPRRVQTTLVTPRTRALERGRVARTVADEYAMTSEREGANEGFGTNEEMSDDVRALTTLVADSDGGAALGADARKDADAMIGKLESVGADATVKPNDDPKIFGYYDVSYVSVGEKQVGNPAGGRFRSPLGRFLFKTIGLEQNLFAPNKIENRVAFTLFGCLPGEVALEGTFAPAEGVDDGRTVKASFGPPGISVAGGPKLRIGPKSSVVLSTTYLDDHVRLGKGSRGSLFVFTRKSEEKAERDHRRWGIGGLAIAIMLLTALGLGIFGVHELRTTSHTLYSVTVVLASAISLAMAYILRDGGIVAEDADLDDDVGELSEQQKAFLSRGRGDGENKGENVFSSQKA